MTSTTAARASRLPPTLVALTPGSLGVDDEGARARLVERVRAAAGEGLRGVLLREPALFDRDLLELGERLRDVLGDGGWLGIHDRAYLLASGSFDGVQLGWNSLPPATVAGLLASTGAAPASVGFSAHADDPTETCAGADFLLMAPVYPTASHPDPHAADYRAPLGPDGLRRAVAAASAPVWALGGIDADRAGALADSGARGFAVRGALLGRSSPSDAAESARALLAAWSGGTG